jgi:hypothetical protein
MRPLVLAALIIAATALPAQAMTITAHVTGGNISVYDGPGEHHAVIGRIADGTEIPVDYCTQVDSDSRRGTLFGDAGHTLWGANARQWCRIPDYGWVERSWLTGRGLVNVTPPDFVGKGW